MSNSTHDPISFSFTILFITLFCLIIYIWTVNQLSSILTSDWYQCSCHSLSYILYKRRKQHTIGRWWSLCYHAFAKTKQMVSNMIQYEIEHLILNNKQLQYWMKHQTYLLIRDCFTTLRIGSSSFARFIVWGRISISHKRIKIAQKSYYCIEYGWIPFKCDKVPSTMLTSINKCPWNPQWWPSMSKAIETKTK